MADIDRILAWYQSGVRFVCGCEADSLHAAVIRALRTGRLPVEALYRCPLHGARLIGWPHRTGAHAAEPGSSLPEPDGGSTQGASGIVTTTGRLKMKRDVQVTEKESRPEQRRSFARFVPKSRKPMNGRGPARELPLRLLTRGFEVEEQLHEYVRRRVGFRLGKFAPRLTGIMVWVENAAGPKGAPAYVCKFRVLLPGWRAVVVAAQEASVHAAIDTAVDATERAVRRRLDRRRRGPRTSAQFRTA